MKISISKMRIIITFIGLLAIAKVNGQQFIAFNSSQCIRDCFSQYSDAVFCSYGREYGVCCAADDTTNPLCQTNPSQGVYCTTQLANQYNFMKYTYCPRKTAICSTQGTVLRPLLNQNQTVSVNNQMLQENGDVCYWELKVETS